MCAVNEKKQIQLRVAKFIGLRFLYRAIVSSLFFLIFCGFLSSGFISAAFFLSQPLSTSLEQGSTVRVCYLLEFFALFVFRFFTLILVGLRVILMLFFNGLVGFLRAHRSCFRPF